MGKKLPPEQLELYNTLDEILWKDWDPIGVYGTEEARDEYYSYLPDVFQMVLRGASASEIAEHLHRIANENMGLGSSLSDHTAVAEKIHGLEKKQ